MRKLAGRPFVLLGINTDEDQTAIKAAMIKHKLDWRSWWDYGSTSGRIATQWQVANWPTIYLIDHTGIIRHIIDDGGRVDTKPLDAAIEKLVKAAEEAATVSDAD